MFRPFLFRSLLSTFIIIISANAQAWGERGHDLVTRVAVQNLRALSKDDANVVKPFLSRDHMLAHLSNVPDIVWRADYQSELVLKVNAPTHYINLEKVYQGVTLWDDLPESFRKYSEDSLKAGFEASEVGTAPWRVIQFYKRMVLAMQAVGRAKEAGEFEAAVNRVLDNAGLMSHFVGDLANPHHTTANYDGQLTGQRGLHGYFESDTVAEQGFDLVASIERQARRNWLTQYSKIQRQEILSDPQKLVWALVANSHSRLPVLLALDKKYSLLEPSAGDKGSPSYFAKRKSAKASARHYKKFAIQRLGIGASALSQLWLLAWEEAGSPDMSKFRSYYYPVKPDFISPDY